MAQERLQKILAAAGVASRRKAEELITAGRISVNGEKITALGSKADARSDEIRLDGQLLRGPERHVYVALYKPKGYVTTVSDPEGRPVVLDLLKGVDARVFPVGRLDYASEGLLLLTNDGELMQQLTRTASHVPKTYQVKVSGTPTEEQIDKLRGGIHLPPETSRAGTMGGTRPGMPRRSQSEHTLPARIDLVRHQDNPWYEVTLTEGRNRQIRRMFEQIGHHVEKIKRVRYGALQLDVEPGKWRFLKPRELEALRNPKPLRAASARPGERGGRPFTTPGKAFSAPGPPEGARRGDNRPSAPSVRSVPEQRPRSPEQRPSRSVSESPARRARPQDREFSSRPRQQRPESRRPERPFEPRREFGSARERPSRPERARGGPDRRGSTGTRPFDKARGSKGPARGEQRSSRPAAESPARRAGSTDREFFSRPRQQRSESRHPERPFEPRQEFGSARERPSRPEHARSGPDRRGPRPFDKARGTKGPARGEGKFIATDRRPSRTPGRNPRNKSGGRPGR
ncbi:MAG: pseudouridine synthase [Candidatus Korobacteraceae bacterium]|jgi:23S rRNA pseudouridine2605 synthase